MCSTPHGLSHNQTQNQKQQQKINLQYCFFTTLTIEKTILETSGIWDTDYSSDIDYIWEPEFMTISITWKLRVGGGGGGLKISDLVNFRHIGGRMVPKYTDLKV